jgi:hypothetical protein
MSYLPKNKKYIRFPILLCSNQNQYIFIQGLVLRKSYVIYCQASMHGLWFFSKKTILILVEEKKYSDSKKTLHIELNIEYIICI